MPPQSSSAPPSRPSALVLDVNETLSDLAPMSGRFEDVGAPGSLSSTWFASVLRDGFALTAAGAHPAFADVASAALAGVLTAAGVDDVAGAVEHVMRGFSELDVHDDVPEGLGRLAGAGFRLVTLTNGAASVADGLLRRAGLRDVVERLMSVEDAPAWKPAAAAYRYAVDALGLPASELLLVAVHPWDVDGAKRAGLQAAWIDRSGVPYPDVMTPPDLTASSFVELAEQLTG